jgi:hypothetical protein
MDRLRPASEQALRHMAEELVDAPDGQLFGPVGLRLTPTWRPLSLFVTCSVV